MESSKLKKQVNRDVDWLELLDDIVHQIVDKLINYKDYVYFGVVCKKWRSIYTQGIQSHLLCRERQFPMLLLPSEINQEGQTRCLYNVVEKRVCRPRMQLSHTRRCIGSSHGWLVIVCENYDVYLHNPFLLSPGNDIQLPSSISFKRDDGYVDELLRVILSDNPTLNPTSFIVMAIYSGSCHLAFCKPGDEVWTLLDGMMYNAIDGALYYREQFYIIRFQGVLFTWDLNFHSPMLSEVLSGVEIGEFCGFHAKYLVELSGGLFLIKRFRAHKGSDPLSLNYQTVGFRVLKLNLDEHKVTEVKSLDGYAVFVGNNSSFSIRASEFFGCKPNCIYFTDDYFEGYIDVEIDGIGPQDFGVFSLDDGSIEPYYPMESDMINPAPVWVEPTLQALYNN
ncbi:hypothetical protein ACHQM5_022503 [Ranunculus cassubicifolius]